MTARQKIGDKAERKAMADYARAVRASYPTRRQLNHTLAQNVTNRLARLIAARKDCGECAPVPELSALPQEYE